METDLISGADVQVLILAPVISAVISLLRTARERGQQRQAGVPLTPWAVAVPETLLGAFLGTLAALAITDLKPAWRTLYGVGSVATVIALLAPKILDLLSRHGLSLVLNYLAGLVTGPLSSWARSRALEVPDDGEADPPPPHPDGSRSEGGDADGGEVH